MNEQQRQTDNMLLQMIQRHFPSLPVSDEFTDWGKWLGFARAAFDAGAQTRSAAAADVLAERQRQMDGEGWTEAHDDEEHLDGDLARAAATYALYDLGVPGKAYVEGLGDIALWPWDFNWFKPKDRRRNLVRAAALLIAEIERLDRTQSRRRESVARASQDMTTNTRQKPTLSMRAVQYEDGSYGVEVTVTGLGSEQQAEAAMLHMQSMFCGQEIASNDVEGN